MPLEPLVSRLMKVEANHDGYKEVHSSFRNIQRNLQGFVESLNFCG